MISTKIGAILLSENLITEEQLAKAIEVQKKEGGRLGSILVKLGFVDEGKIAEFLSQQYGVPYVDLKSKQIDPKVLSIIPKDLCRKYMVVPFDRAGNVLSVAIADPSNAYALEDLRFITGYTIKPFVAVESSINAILEAESSTDLAVSNIIEDSFELDELEIEEISEKEISVDALRKEVEDTPIVKFVNYILHEAIKRGASDIHVEPYEKEFRIRLRVDGVLYDLVKPPRNIKDAVISRLKILADLDIAEKRLPQDGRIKLKLPNKSVDMRVSTLPVLFGEKVVLRLLDKSNLQLDLEKLGFEPSSLERFIKGIESPYGMVLVTGPTGSGKSTTLYSALSRLNKVDVNIMTAEDPVEYNIFGINQVQIKDEIGLNFASALRSFLRQDPDIIMVGEIRDYETAEIAIKAALTGHLVLSTLHTNDAPSTINRLLNMGIEPFLVASSTVVILAQRLARRICSKCAEKVKIPAEALLSVGFRKDELDSFVPMKGKGCDACGGTGYKGRLALYEVMTVSEGIRELILRGANANELKKAAIEEGMITLRRSGLEKIKKGITTLEEVVRVTFAD
ncbi:type IV-A pilus assembly ATPase PilB [Calditerrivibrio nitroreducens]|uniref:Type IV-A pilus assembly ATPase PilB n=1 Tax=Calditerrivibrio nitroreducens (strain DSM 19672 / NBRC 101217 / Yu37-1) TaxID=768670 RepID=E4TFI2_CALNY|nr:type IV-A pilus assembly ATPase PilB [Calditerrivibrio nitroreducens]ADR19555.1 type IV-A pilus assembly ATPase PilB [Calditerrivibrio nitroreducens DSM 19672]